MKTLRRHLINPDPSLHKSIAPRLRVYEMASGICGLALATMLSLSCSTTKCKTIDNEGNVRDPSNPPPMKAAETSSVKTAPAQTNALPPVVTNSGTTTVESPAAVAPPATVKVYKYDNSRQCGQGTPISLEDMGKQLGKVKVISQEKKNDGMMRIQMCGAPAGIANVYEIDQKDLKKAVKAGFREWKYSQQ